MDALANSRITLIVGGSIAAYKSAELVRELRRQGTEVNAILTRGGAAFITPLTLQTLSGRPVSSELFDLRAEAEIGHIALADQANLVLVAPATADLMAKAAAGIADDLASTVLLATKAPVLFAPAMNVNMWQHLATQHNYRLLQSRGVQFVDPEEGELACGWLGQGRLATVERIVDYVEYALREQDLQGVHVIVSAGPCREPCDPVRFISNYSSGKMGYALAKAARSRGAKVSLVSGPTNERLPAGVECVSVQTGAEMREAIVKLVSAPLPSDEQGERLSGRMLLMAAAVSDHRPRDVAATKLKRDKSLGYALEMEPVVDILQELGENRLQLAQSSGGSLKLVGFAAETASKDSQLIQLAREKLQGKNLDMVVANDAQSMGQESSRVFVVNRSGHLEIAVNDKYTVAHRIISAAVKA